jgi:hypothetical protein
MKKLNWKAKLAVAALAVSAAMPASAALTGAAGGNSSLFLTVWNGANSYSRDLGTTLDGFLASAATGATFAGDALFASVFGTSTAPLSWNIAAGDTTYVVGTDPARLLVTGGLGLTPTGTRTGLITAGTAVTLMTSNLNAAGCATAASCTVLAGAAGDGSITAPTANAWGSNIGGGTTIATVGGATSQLAMYLLSSIGGTAGLTNSVTQSSFSASGQQSYFTLNAATGAVTWNVASVPVPAAVWLLGSGLLGLIGVGRRKSVVAA